MLPLVLYAWQVLGPDFPDMILMTPCASIVPIYFYKFIGWYLFNFRDKLIISLCLLGGVRQMVLFICLPLPCLYICTHNRTK